MSESDFLMPTRDFVKMGYRIFLGREPWANDVELYAEHIDSGAMTRRFFAKAMLDSDEANARRAEKATELEASAQIRPDWSRLLKPA